MMMIQSPVRVGYGTALKSKYRGLMLPPGPAARRDLAIRVAPGPSGRARLAQQLRPLRLSEPAARRW